MFHQMFQIHGVGQFHQIHLVLQMEQMLNRKTQSLSFTKQVIITITLNASNPNGADTETKTNVISVSSSISSPYVEDFETAGVLTNDWTVVNVDNSYTWQESNTIVGADGSSTKAAMVDFYNYTLIGQVDYLESNLFDLTNMNNGSLTFDVAYAQKTGVSADELAIEVSYDCGQSWIPTSFLQEGSNLATVAPSPSSWEPTSETHWRNEQLDLTPYYGFES